MRDKFEKITEEDVYDERENFFNKLCERAKRQYIGLCADYEIGLKDSLIDTESPIEQILALELSRCDLRNFNTFNPFIDVLDIEKQVNILCGDKVYRVDFLISVNYMVGNENNLKMIVVECDGHRYHEITPEQAKERNERDRILNQYGYSVLHFTGSEIYNKPMKCVGDIIRFIKKGFENYVKI